MTLGLSIFLLCVLLRLLRGSDRFICYILIVNKSFCSLGIRMLPKMSHWFFLQKSNGSRYIIKLTLCMSSLCSLCRHHLLMRLSHKIHHFLLLPIQCGIVPILWCFSSLRTRLWSISRGGTCKRVSKIWCNVCRWWSSVIGGHVPLLILIVPQNLTSWFYFVNLNLVDYWVAFHLT